MITPRAYSAKPLLLLVLLLSQSAWAQPVGLAVNSRGFLPDDQVHVLWEVDLATGEVQRIGQTGFIDMEGLALAPDGTLYGADDESKTLVTINTETGFSTPVGGVTRNMGMPVVEPLDFGMTFTCDGELLLVSDYEQTLFVADLETGELTRVGQAGGLGAPITGLAAWGDALYGIGQGVRGIDGQFSTDSPNLYRIDRENGTSEWVGPLGDGVRQYANAGLAFDADGGLWALTDRRENGVPDIASEILAIDPETGAAEKIADSELVGFESLAISTPGGCDTGVDGTAPQPATPVPAAGTLSLATLILLILAVSGWTLSTRQR